MIIGYLRVSTKKQYLSNQQDEIRRFAESKNFTIDSWVTEVASGKKKGQDRKLGALLKRMKPGDTLIVTEISRLSRTLTDIMAIMGKCLSKEINLYTT
ncbi:MAG TPA: recombinase family protein, partial [Candidatus Avirikenella pullistercoris]|nr:recombinase family protein [Candidatus Avirikenella pullistercoris]